MWSPLQLFLALLAATSMSLLPSVSAVETRLLLRVLEDCTSATMEPSLCLKAKLVTVLDRAARAEDVELVEGVHLVGSGGSSPDPPLTETHLEAQLLPRSSSAEREALLDTLIADKLSAFFQGHSLQFKLAEIPRSLGIHDEGRGRKGKKGLNSLLMLMFMMASTMLPIKMGTLAMLAGKALIISKLALALAAIVGLKKLLGSEHHDDSYQVVQVPHSHHRRSLTDLPYRAHRPV